MVNVGGGNGLCHDGTDPRVTVGDERRCGMVDRADFHLFPMIL